jgi:hypothetical protein
LATRLRVAISPSFNARFLPIRIDTVSTSP